MEKKKPKKKREQEEQQIGFRKRARLLLVSFVSYLYMPIALRNPASLIALLFPSVVFAALMQSLYFLFYINLTFLISMSTKVCCVQFSFISAIFAIPFAFSRFLAFRMFAFNSISSVIT